MLSVIIPTHNRQEILKKCLFALKAQLLKADQYEIIVVDDGSTDQTKKMVNELKEKQLPNLSYFYQTNQGQGNARNLGIQKAKGEIIVLIGDDIIVTPDFLAEHQKIHTLHPEKNAAVLGFIDWHPDLKVTPFMRFLTNGSCIFGKYGGHQFAFEKLADKEVADYNFFYTSNLSLKKELLLKYPFATEFSKYGWEDIELGYRLTKQENLTLYYQPKATAYHLHPFSEKDLAPRMRLIGESAYLIHQKYPELQKIPSQQKKFVFWLISNSVSLSIFKAFALLFPVQKTQDYYYYALSKKYYLEGLKTIMSS